MKETKETSETKKEEKKKLIIASDNSLPRWDGIARFLKEITPKLSEEFETITIIPDFGPIEENETRTIKIPLSRIKAGDYILPLMKYGIIKEEVKKADLVFVQTIGPIGLATIIAAKKQKKKIINYVHSLESELVPMAVGPSKIRKYLYKIMRPYVRWVYNKPTLLITPSEWVSDILNWQKIRTRKKVIQLGVDTKKFSPNNKIREETRKKLGIKEDEILIGTVGRLAWEKDIKTLIRAYLRAKKKNKKIRLIIIADGLKKFKEEISRKEEIILIDDAEEVTDYLRAMDLFIITSLIETTCLAALEAMSTGLPIIGTPVGFLRNYIKEGKNGYLTPKKDTITLTNKILLLSENKELRKKIGEEARKTIKEHFKWEETEKKIIETLKEEATKN